MQPDQLTYAYLAGIIDADGFISAHRKKNRGVIYCGPLLGIAGTDSEPHQLAKETWGGSFFEYIPKNPLHRKQYQWQAVGLRAATAINNIRPYLRTKPAQADLALEMWSHIANGMHRTDSLLLEMAERLSSMNIRNPPKKLRKAPIPADLLVRQWPADLMPEGQADG